MKDFGKIGNSFQLITIFVKTVYEIFYMVLDTCLGTASSLVSDIKLVGGGNTVITILTMFLGMFSDFSQKAPC